MVSLNPKKGYYLSKKVKETPVTTKSKGKVKLPTDNMKVEEKIKRLSSSPSVQDLLRTVSLMGMVGYVYASNSRVMKGSEGLLAVRLRSGEKGWLTKEGRFIGQDVIYRMLYSIDNTLVGAGSGVSLADLYAKMSPAQRVRFMDAIKDFDWEKFWEEDYELGDDDYQIEVYFGLLEIIESVVGTK